MCFLQRYLLVNFYVFLDNVAFVTLFIEQDGAPEGVHNREMLAPVLPYDSIENEAYHIILLYKVVKSVYQRSNILFVQYILFHASFYVIAKVHIDTDHFFEYYYDTIYPDLRMSRILAILLFLLSVPLLVQAGPDSARMVHFDIANGLPGNNVYSIIKDKFGYTWFATEKGAVKYNGYTFTTYNTGDGLPSDDVFELIPDKMGRVWVHSFSYRSGYIRDGHYKELNYNTTKKVIRPVYASQAGDMYYFQGGDINETSFIFITGGLIKVIPLGKQDRWQRDKKILDGYMGDDLTYYIMDDHEQVYRWDILKGVPKYTYVMKADEPLLYGYRYRRSLSPKQELYSFRFNGTLLHNNDFRKGYIHQPLSIMDMGGNADETIYSFNAYYLNGNFRKNSILITNTHVYTIDKDFRLIGRTAITDIVPTNSQLAYSIQDKMGNDWYATKGDGVWISARRDTFFSTGKLNALLWRCRYAGTLGNISYWWDRSITTLYAVANNEISDKIVFPAGTSIRNVTGSPHIIFIGGESGIFEYHTADKKLVALDERYDTRIQIDDPRPNLRVMKQNKRSAFEYVNLIRWHKDGLYSLGSEYMLYHQFKDDSIVVTARSIERFSDIQIGEHKTLSYNAQKLEIADNATGKVTVFEMSALRDIGINSIRQIETDSYGNWYFLSDERLMVCNASARVFKEIDIHVGLREAQMKISGDHIVVAGRFGIGYMVIGKYARFSNFRVVTNFMAGKPYYNEVRGLSVSENGYILLQTDQGVFDLSLEELKLSATYNTAKGDIVQLLLSAPYDATLTNNDTFAIRQEEQLIQLNVVSYLGKGALKYHYALPGSDKWAQSTSGEIFVSNLEPGKYHKILCKVNDELWESKVQTIYIYRYPKWWQTSTWKTAFWLTGILLFLGIVLLAVLLTRSYVAGKNERKRALTELELQAIHSQINPHFIFNTLSAALFYINKKRFDDAYVHVNKFSQLLRSYLKSSQDRYVMLDEEIKILRNYIELQQIRFEEKFEYSIEIDNKLPTNNIRIPSLLLQPLVENAINHGLFHMEKGGILLLRFEQGADNTELICSIEDNGVGRSAAKKINEVSATKESYGTKLTNRLLEVFKLYENLNIDLKYFDKQLPETGTIVILTLKNVKYVA